MQNEHLSRPRLYELLTEKSHDLGFNPASSRYKIDAIALAHRVCPNLMLEIIPFATGQLCGILVRQGDMTAIGLNARRSPAGRNFDCMHELVHFWFHKGNTFNCIENGDSFLEWQANEGASQFLMPYQSFIPAYCDLYDKITPSHSPARGQNLVIARLCAAYGAGELAVRFRINTLSREIAQYINGTPIDKIQVQKGSHKKKG
ncbi:MAG: ImmA/IrrE family metallo-endopeptidase [Defluviitaleaceae bacterium]|nr:ImmA/IrrE family metallo-endopeptidase [Defluviitaleaceae bacterium]